MPRRPFTADIRRHTGKHGGLNRARGDAPPFGIERDAGVGASGAMPLHGRSL